MIQHYLAFRAQVSGQATAVVTADRQMSFAVLMERVRAVSAHLRQLNLPAGSLVVTYIADKALDWVLTLAIHHEGLVSCSNLGYAPSEIVNSDWRFSDRGLQHGDLTRTSVVDWAWLDALPSASVDIAPRAFPQFEAPTRLFLTSGTTGHRKAVALSDRAHLARVEARGSVFEPFKIFTPMPLGAGVGFNLALFALVRGAPLYEAPTGEDAFNLLARHAVESFVGSPMQILGLLRAVSANGVRPAALSVVRSTGGPLSPALISGVREQLGAVLVNEYGSTESGRSALCVVTDGQSAAHAGMALPGCVVQIVDAEHRPLPLGEEGTVRIRTPYMAQGYHGNAEQSARSFRDGFFYPGDCGRLESNGQLLLVGRQSEIINRGGVKIDPATIDAVMLEQPWVRDAAAFAAPGPGGLPEIAAAVVVEDGFDAAVFRAALRKRLGYTREPKAILRLPSIPRTAVGKVQREALAEILMQAAGRRMASVD